jgi:DNA (cytosine-5)-methyltransferase 1
MLTFGSLFAGIGGLDLGLERAGMRCAWQVEIDDYATRVLTKHWPDVPKFRDVRSVGADNLSAVDLICGGFPCQDISSSGKRAGITGARSGLWSEFARVIRELRPRYVLVENVSALLHRGIDRVLGDLAALGYDAEWHCISAAALGAPHRRDRVFIVAYADGQRQSQPQGVISQERRWTRDRSEALANAQCDRWQQGTEVFRARQSVTPTGSQDVSDATSARSLSCAPTGLYSSQKGTGTWHEQPERYDWWATEPDVGRMAYGVPARVDRLRGLGNAVVPQVAEFVGKLIMEHAHAT